MVEPAVGRLTGADSGKGRLPDPDAIVAVAEQVLARPSAAPDLLGRTVVVSAGGTREPVDPVRFLGNRSSGRQGYALAAAAVARGARVDARRLPTSTLPDPAGATVHRVETAAELQGRGPRPRSVGRRGRHGRRSGRLPALGRRRPQDQEGRGRARPMVLEPTDDVLAALVAGRGHGQVVVGFAAETGDDEADWLQHGPPSSPARGATCSWSTRSGDGLAFGTDDNAAVVLGRDGSETEVARGPKPRSPTASGTSSSGERLARVAH